MTIAMEYAVVSEDGKSLLLPAEVHSWLKGIDRFLVIMEKDRLVLKKTHKLKKLDTLVPDYSSPLSSDELDQLIHESRS
ncbi:MAG: hypothetical protein AB7S75_21625 [Desulfococcaceae bacterium]